MDWADKASPLIDQRSLCICGNAQRPPRPHPPPLLSVSRMDLRYLSAFSLLFYFEGHPLRSVCPWPILPDSLAPSLITHDELHLSLVYLHSLLDVLKPVFLHVHFFVSLFSRVTMAVLPCVCLLFPWCPSFLFLFLFFLFFLQLFFFSFFLFFQKGWLLPCFPFFCHLLYPCFLISLAKWHAGCQQYFFSRFIL